MLTVFVGFVAVLLIIFLSLPAYAVCLGMIRSGNEKGAHSFGQKCISLGLRILFICTASRISIVGKENIPKEGPVLFVSNHRSNVDPVLAYAYTPKDLGFVAKIEIEKIPYLRAWMRLLHCLFLDRNNMKQGLKTILQAIENIKAGYSMWICPEGTRIRTGGPTDTLEFHAASVKIATKGNCPVVPVAFYGTREMLEDHMPWLARGKKVVMAFGKPVMPGDVPEDVKDLGEYYRQIISGMLIDIHEGRLG